MADGGGPPAVRSGLCLSALPAQAQTVPLREAATSTLRAATATNALQAGSSSPPRRRSVGRTVGGIILMGLGTPFLIVGLAAEETGGSICAGGDCLTIEVDTGGAGYGVAALGGALARFSDSSGSDWARDEADASREDTA